MREALSFDDVLMVPKYFNGHSRSEIDISTEIAGIKLKIPILSANMSSVTGLEMATVLAEEGGLPILHRMCSIQEESEIILQIKEKDEKLNIGASIGVGSDWKERTQELIKVGSNIICIDVAHGDQGRVKNIAIEFRKEFNDFPLIIGNFAAVPEWADMNDKTLVLKAGVGSGSACTTRIATGCGVPTFQSVQWLSPYFDTIADGGIKTSGDIVKSLAAGANSVMVGSLFAGTAEAPGSVVKGKDGAKYKVYKGSASYGGKQSANVATSYIEGVETLVPYKGSVRKIINQLCDGIRSGLSYCGASSLKELNNNAEFIKISPAGYRESLPHGIL